MSFYLKGILMSLAYLPLTLVGQVQDTTATMEALEPEEGTTTSEIGFFGDYYVAVGETSKENVKVYGGDLFVAGAVDGQIVVVGGDATLESTAIVTGRIVTIGGTVFQNEGATVKGEIVQANIRKGINIARPEDFTEGEDFQKFDFEDKFTTKERLGRESLIHPDVDSFIYNRDEGLLLTPFNWRWDRGGRSTFRTSLSLGYRFGQSELAGRLTLEKTFGSSVGPILFISAFRQSRSDDNYRIPEDENSLSSLFARQDFLDRWGEEGYEAGAAFRESFVQAKLAYRSVEAAPFDEVTNLISWFNKDRNFRPPMTVSSGNLNSIAGNIIFGTLNRDFLSTRFMISLKGESVLSSDNLENFDRFFTAFHLSWELRPDILIRTRTMVGESQGVLPRFRAFGVGGLGSVSAHPYKAQTGNRMAQLNAELLLLPEFISGHHYFAMFVDTGNAWNRDIYGFTDFSSISENGLSAAGIGIGDEDFDWRINIARPLDGRDTWETTFRFNLNF